ncbi:MAG: amidohydrolase [Thermaerobacter sp.]|nr:amidohydrolase [Thermaerobacter sp.]
MAPWLVRWRRAIHQRPELSFQEYETASMVAGILREIPGCLVQTNVAGTTGVVARIGRGEGPVMALRADMDALPVDEVSTHSFRSQTPGAMHACGHDGHSAILLGVAHMLAEAFAQDEMHGQVILVFQPAEETPDARGQTGAPYLLASGLLEEAEAIVALHLDPEYPVGTVRLNDGPSMAAVDNFRGVILGQGGHGGYPHMGTDPLWMMVPVLQTLYGLVSRRVSPLEPAVVSIGRVAGGTTSNVLPPEVLIEGTMRSYDEKTRYVLMQEVERAFRLVRGLGGEYRLDILRGEPAVKNHPGVNRVLAAVVRDTLGPQAIVTGPFGMGGEDFGFMAEAIPGALFFLGCAPKDGPRSLHAPTFDLNEDCLPVGALLLAETVKRFLQTSRAPGGAG